MNDALALQSTSSSSQTEGSDEGFVSNAVDATSSVVTNKAQSKVNDLKNTATGTYDLVTTGIDGFQTSSGDPAARDQFWSNTWDTTQSTVVTQVSNKAQDAQKKANTVLNAVSNISFVAEPEQVDPRYGWKSIAQAGIVICSIAASVYYSNSYRSARADDTYGKV